MSLARIGRLFPRNDTTIDAVTTSFRFVATPEQVWHALMFYEDVPLRPSPVLRPFLPLPVKSVGDKQRVGGLVHCTYEGGTLDKQITAIERGRRIAFDVTSQALGIEDAITMSGGSYEVREDGDGVVVELTTRYRGHLRPRWLFRPLERLLARQVHRHILGGMATALDGSATAAPSPRIAVDG